MKVTTQEIGVLLMAIGQVMIKQGVVAGVLVGPTRDKESDNDVFTEVQELDDDMSQERMLELLDMNFEDLEGAGA